MKIERVVIFGHRPTEGRGIFGLGNRTHTHSYIHSGYVRAFEYLGYDTYWLDSKSPDLVNFPTKGTLFFTEDQVDGDIPLSKESAYVTHSSSKSKYEDHGVRRLNLCNYVADLQTGQSYNYPANQVERIDNVTFFDSKANALYQPWAASLLPYEIVPSDAVKFDPSRKLINYVGTIGHDNIGLRIKEFERQAKKSGKSIKIHSGVNDSAARDLIRDSLLAVDIRGDWHLERGYIPCRLWKNISYGMHVGSNSTLMEQVFEGRITIASDPATLFDETLRVSSQTSMFEIEENMKWIREYHTFVNRAQRVIEAVQLV